MATKTCSHLATANYIAFIAVPEYSRRVTTSRRILAFVLLVALLALTPVAYASPPDQTWFPGLYDDDDFDNVILFIATNLGTVESDGASCSRPVEIVVGFVAPASPFTVAASPLSSGPSRAPPLA